MIRKKNHKLQKANSAFGRLAADRKKTILAVCLLAVMGFMWFRVLTNKKPPSAGAASPPPAEQQDTQQRPLNVRFVTVPKVPGRNDAIHRDFFAVQDWEPFRQKHGGQNSGTDTEVHIVSSDQRQEVVLKVAKKLKLEAVLWSEFPKAFLNDELVGVGDKLKVKDGPNVYEFEVLRIFEEAVLVGCNGTRLTLKLARYLDVSK